MMNRLATTAVTGVLAATVASLALAPAPATAGGKSRDAGAPAVGLVGGDTLVAFSLSTPSRTRTIGDVDGLQGDTSLVGIDYRVQDGKLYGVGDQGGVYTLSTDTGDATLVTRLTVPLSGSTFGVDFNPAANALRVVSDTGQNLRQPFATAGAPTANDSTLTYPATPTAPATTATGVNGAAYTNNDLDAATATTLFDLDTALDQVVVQSPANAGLLAATGKFGTDAKGDTGFDIGERRGVDTGYATINTGGGYALYRVELLTGDVDKIGSFSAKTQVTDLALPIAD